MHKHAHAIGFIVSNFCLLFIAGAGYIRPFLLEPARLSKARPDVPRSDGVWTASEASRNISSTEKPRFQVSLSCTDFSGIVIAPSLLAGISRPQRTGDPEQLFGKYHRDELPQ